MIAAAEHGIRLRRCYCLPCPTMLRGAEVRDQEDQTASATAGEAEASEHAQLQQAPPSSEIPASEVGEAPGAANIAPLAYHPAKGAAPSWSSLFKALLVLSLPIMAEHFLHIAVGLTDTSADRYRLICWLPWEERPFADLHLMSRTRNRLADVAVM